MRSIRRAVSNRLLEFGADLARDRQEMWQKAQQSGVRSLTYGDYQVLGALDLWSRTAIRLGMMIMPAVWPDLPDGSTDLQW